MLRIARQAAAGLAAAHAQGVVHRDVKPANILLGDSVDRVLLSDFGLARTVDDATLTRSGVLAGTPHYMSPEQASGLSVDQRSDLFSLGSVIYFMCTGRPPYRSESPMAILNRICHEAHRPVDDVNPDVPLELAEVVDRLLAKAPDKRFATAREVETRCAELLAHMQQGRRLRRRSWWRQRQQRSQRNGGKTLKRLTVGLAAAAACMLIGASLTRLFTPRTTAPSDGSASTSANADLLKAVLPDTFVREITEVDGQLAAIEARNALDSAALVSSGDPQWQNDLSKLQADVSQMEESFGRRSPTPATDTPHPASERKKR